MEENMPQEGKGEARIQKSIGRPLKFATTVNVKEVFPGLNLTPQGIIAHLSLRQPIYSKTAEWGHYGHDSFSWENV